MHDFELIKSEMISIAQEHAVKMGYNNIQMNDLFDNMWSYAFKMQNSKFTHISLTEFDKNLYSICENSAISEDLMVIYKAYNRIPEIYQKMLESGNKIDNILIACQNEFDGLAKHEFSTKEGAQVAATVIGVARSSYGLHHYRIAYIEEVTGETVTYGIADWDRERFDAIGKPIAIAGGGAIGGGTGALVGYYCSSWLSGYYDLGDAIGRWLF